MTRSQRARRARQIQKCYADYSDAELKAMFDRIGDNPEHLVKKTGHVKKFWAKKGDELLDELRRRRFERAIDAEAQDWAKHFEVTDADQIEGRRRVMRANVAANYFEPLEAYLA